MKNIFITLLFILIVSGCKRNEPVDIILPIEISTLQPTQVIDLSSILVEPSGITYNKLSNSLLIVSDERPDIYVVDLQGHLLDKISVSGVDMEGITLTKNADTIYVVEETAKLVSSFYYDGRKINSMTVDVATNPSNILEGVTIDNRGHLYVLNEKAPRLMMEFYKSVELSRVELTYTTDISDICYDDQENCFWIVSDESKKIIKIDKSGNLLGQWLITYQKGEGITFVGDKMYIVCDADSKMYIYNKPH